jgi:hypothetical protein
MDVRNWVKDNEANSYIILGIRRFNVADDPDRECLGALGIPPDLSTRAVQPRAAEFFMTLEPCQFTPKFQNIRVVVSHFYCRIFQRFNLAGEANVKFIF